MHADDSPAIAATEVVRAPAPADSRRLPRLALAVATLLLMGLVVTARAFVGGSPSLPLLGDIPAFTMLDQRGQKVTTASLQGQVLIVDFFYASCPTSCPRLSAQMASFQERIAARSAGLALPVHLVSITLDPANDTPEVLSEYAQRFHAKDANWSFLSGRSEELDQVVVKGFKLHFARVDPAAGLGAIMHGEWFVLVDGKGKIRGYYQIGDEERMNELVRDAEHLARRGAA